MSSWNDLVARAVVNGGVVTFADALACGVSARTWQKRTGREAWGTPFRGVRVAPWAQEGQLTALRAALAASRGRAAAAGITALWLLGLRDEPARLHLAVPHDVHLRAVSDSGIRVSRCRWLRDDDVEVRDGVRRLRPEAIVVSLAPMGVTAVRPAMIDLVQAGRTTPDRVFERVATVGAIHGRAGLELAVEDLGGRRPESWFHDSVLTDLLDRGYPVERAPRRTPTPDGRGVLGDITMLPFLLIIDPQGDRFHRGRAERRADRRRVAQLAGTDHVLVPIDWRDWHERHGWVLDTIDAAILRQLRAGHGTVDDLPPHLRARVVAESRVGN